MAKVLTPVKCSCGAEPVFEVEYTEYAKEQGMRLGCDRCEVWINSDPYPWGVPGSAALMYARRVSERVGLIRRWEGLQKNLETLEAALRKHKAIKHTGGVSFATLQPNGYLEIHTITGGAMLIEPGLAKTIMEDKDAIRSLQGHGAAPAA